MIISIGYRVNSKKGIQFRIWANKILKEYLLKGYSINKKRLEYLEKTVKLIDIASKVQEDHGQRLLKIINDYTNTFTLLDSYDRRSVSKPNGTMVSEKRIDYEYCANIIQELKQREKSDLFGLERGEGIKSIINNIYQSFDDKDLYPSIEEKGANLLYLITKNHCFIDGNKRIAATIFLYFLEYYNILYQIIKN